MVIEIILVLILVIAIALFIAVIVQEADIANKELLIEKLRKENTKSEQRLEQIRNELSMEREYVWALKQQLEKKV